MLLDLDHATWVETCDAKMTLPVKRDLQSPFPRVVDRDGNAMTMTNEAAGIIRAFWDMHIPLCACSRGKQRSLYEEVAKAMVLDAPVVTFNLWSYIGNTAFIQPNRGSELPHVLDIREKFRNGRRRYYANLELN